MSFRVLITTPPAPQPGSRRKRPTAICARPAVRDAPAPASAKSTAFGETMRSPPLLLRLALLFASPYKGICKPRGAIIYLAQVRHASYGRDSLAYLELSLRHLFHYYNEQQRDDVIILHEGDFEADTQARVLAPYAGHPIRFHLLTSKYWAMPVKLRNTNRSTWEGYPHYSEGYRTMIRFFTVSLWNLMDDLGYEYPGM